jgi:RNA polymerase sigma-70 factor, ECF subfamily
VGQIPVIDRAVTRHMSDRSSSVLSHPDDVALEAGPLRSVSTSTRDQAWRVLYDQQFDRVYRLVCRFGVPLAEAEDVAQQVFVVAHRRLSEISDIENVGGWLRGIAVKLISEHHRWRRVRHVRRWIVQSLYGDDRDDRPTPTASLESAEVRARVAAVLRDLSPKLRAVLVLCDIEELDLAEVAATLAIPINTVRSRRRLARASFQRLWQGQPGDRP